MLTRQAPLRVVQAQVGACGQGQRHQACQCSGITCAGFGQQGFGLFLEMAQIGPGGKTFHENLRASDADGLQFRQHKGEVMKNSGSQSASGLHPVRRPGRGLRPRSAGSYPRRSPKCLYKKLQTAHNA